MNIFNKSVTKKVIEFDSKNGPIVVDYKHGLQVLASEFRRQAHSSITVMLDPETLIEIADILDSYRYRSFWERLFG